MILGYINDTEKSLATIFVLFLSQNIFKSSTKLNLLEALYIYIYIYMCVCVCVWSKIYINVVRLIQKLYIIYELNIQYTVLHNAVCKVDDDQSWNANPIHLKTKNVSNTAKTSAQL